MKKIYTLFLVALPVFFTLYSKAQCTGSPSGFTLVPASQTICAGNTATMMLVSGGSTTGITFQWQSSTVSAVGPFSTINTATSMTYATNSLTMTTWYKVIITCGSSQQSISLFGAVTISNCAQPCNGQPTQGTVTPQT